MGTWHFSLVLSGWEGGNHPLSWEGKWEGLTWKTLNGGFKYNMHYTRHFNVYWSLSLKTLSISVVASMVFGLIQEGKKYNIASQGFANLAGLKEHITWYRVCEWRMCIKLGMCEAQNAKQDTESFQTCLEKEHRSRQDVCIFLVVTVLLSPSLLSQWWILQSLYPTCEGGGYSQCQPGPESPHSQVPGPGGNEKITKQEEENEGTVHLSL